MSTTEGPRKPPQSRERLGIAGTPLGSSHLHVALVGCGKLKAKKECPARDLYIGLPFRLAMRHAMDTADDVHILSALHGLIDPFKIIAPYDISMPQIHPAHHIAWGRKVLDDLKAQYPMHRLRVVFYAGQQYIRPIMKAIKDEDRYWTFENPLEGLDLFQRIRWFKANEVPPF